MISINVKTILGLVNIIGNKKEQKISLDEGANVSDLIDKLVEIYGLELETNLFDHSRITNAGIAMFINGRNIFALNGLETKLNDNDEFLIFPPLCGG